MPVKSISIIGAGNVGYRLGVALYNKGYTIHQVFSRDLNNATELAKLTGSLAVNEWAQIDEASEIYVLCLADDVLPIAATHLRLPGKMVCHTAGSVEADVLLPISDNVGVLYPLQTFSKNRNVDWHQVPILIESAIDDTLRALLKLAKNISIQVHQVGFEQRRKANLAAVFANNFPNHLWAIADEICYVSDISFEWLKPLMHETVSKAMELSPAAAQTGPAHRGDNLTMEKHLQLLDTLNHGHPHWTTIYNDISKSIKEH